jgi:CheY-like chemotaxis protein
MGRTILVADDSATIRKIVELTFSDTGYRVEAVTGGRDAMAALDSLQPDVVLADVVMPEPSGYELCRAIKTSGRPIPVLLLAGTFEPFDPAEARRCGADGHLVKPFESRALRDKVEQLFASAPAARPSTPDAGAATEVDATLAEVETEAPAVDRPRVEAPDPPTPASGGPATAPVPPEWIEAVSREVVRHLSADVLREIAWDVVPKLAGEIIRERIRELERDDAE